MIGTHGNGWEGAHDPMSGTRGRGQLGASRQQARGKDEDDEPLSNAESYLVKWQRWYANEVPSDVADKVIGIIEKWEKAPTAKS
jgi:hypothetical protein